MDHYKVSQSEKVQEAEKELSKDILELRDEIEEATLHHDGDPSKQLNSIVPPAQPAYFQKEREVSINNLIYFNEGQEMKNLADVYSHELEVSKSSDFTEASIPLLLLQFYLDRMSSLVQCKHLHMLRWRRFSEHTEAIERLLSSYSLRLEVINKEYIKAKETARRLSSAHSEYVQGKNPDFSSVRPQDLKTFCIWLICHGQSVKKITSYVNSIQWISVKYKDIFLSSKQSASNNVDDDAEYDVTNPVSYEGFSTPSSCSFQRRMSALAITTPSIFPGFVTNNADIHRLPLYNLNLDEFRQQLESLVLEYGIVFKSNLVTPADEMELFGAVNRKFKNLFNHQQTCSTFYQYDNVPKENGTWGVEEACRCLLKPSPWVKYVKIRARKDPNQLKNITYLKQHGEIDELLLSQNNFVVEKDYSIVTEALKLHSSAIKEQPNVQPIAVASNPNGAFKSTKVWERIYKTSLKKRQEDEEERAKTLSEESIRSKSKEYDYSNTMQMFGLDDGDESAGPQDQNVIQGAYLSYLHLRHLKIRDLRRQVLQLLNYFRSVERTITIFDCGFSLESQTDDTNAVIKSKRSSSKQGRSKNRETTSRNKSRPKKPQKSRTIGTHHHIFNTPADFKVSQDKFMEYMGVENHDDYYSFDYDENAPQNSDDMWREKSRKSSITSSLSRDLGSDEIPHVQDQSGFYIVYDSAVRDFDDLESELLLVGSHYIRKNTMTDDTSSHRVRNFNVDIPIDGKREVDRFAVMHDLWMCELNFTINKRKILDCFVEAYHNTFNSKERRKLAQMITDIIHQRPRHDFSASYFVQLYQTECVCLQQKCSLLTKILVNHIDEQRQFLNRSCRSKTKSGMPFYTAPKQEISPNLPIPSLKHVDIFEFHSYLGSVATRTCSAMDYVIHDVIKMYGDDEITSNQKCLMEKIVYHLALEEWENSHKIGTSYNLQVQKDVFSPVFIDDPLLMSDAVESICESLKTGDSEKLSMSKEISMWKKASELCLLRHRLIDAAYETETLTSLYKQIGQQMGYEEFHASLRLLAFDYAKLKESDEQSISRESFLIDEKKLDRYTPEHLSLSIGEMDEAHISKISFKNRDNIVQILEDRSKLEDIKLALSCQIITKNSFYTAIKQAAHSIRMDELNVVKSQKVEVADENSSTTEFNNAESEAESNGEAERNSQKSVLKRSKKNISFISIQKEKTGPRDAMMNNFLREKGKTSRLKMQNIDELKAMKRKSISEFCNDFNHRLGLHAMRGQIVAHYTSMLNLLQSFPQTLNSYFMIGREFEQKFSQDSAEGLNVSPKKMSRRPRRVMSDDGKEFLNIWFIPHYTEIISSHRHLTYKDQHTILNTWLAIASSLHEIVQFICARSRLGDSKIQGSKQSSAADWGGIQGINNELKEIQSQIDSLPCLDANPAKNPMDVAELLVLRRKSTLMEFNVTVLDSVSETFLATGNTAGYRSLRKNAVYAFECLNGDYGESLTTIELGLPESLLKHDEKVKQMFPWLCFQSCYGPYPTSYKQYWQDIESRVQLCFAGLTDTDRKCANGELLSVGLLLDEVLQQGIEPLLAIDDSLDLSKINTSGAPQQTTEKSDEATNSALMKPLSKIRDPIASYKVIMRFLRLSRQLNIAKYDWAVHKLQIMDVNSLKLYRVFVRIFQNEIALPAYSSMSRQAGVNGQYENVTSDDQILPLPQGVPDIVVRANLLKRLLEMSEIRMIGELRHRISKDLTSFLGEKSRSDEAVLPFDLWQQRGSGSGGGEGSREENLVVSTPQMYHEFVQRLMSDSKSTKDDKGNKIVSFNEDHLNLSLSKLASSIITREKDNFETYSSFYENLLQHHHQLLYRKELQVKLAQENPLNFSSNSAQHRQFQLADRSHELILEVTALRAKVSQLQSEMSYLEDTIRQDERLSCQDLVRELFEACFQMKMKLADYHLSIHEDMRLMVGETRGEAMEALEKLRNEEPTSTAEERLKTIRNKEIQLEKLQEEKYEINMLFNKFKSLTHMRRTGAVSRYKTSIEKMRFNIASTKREYLAREMVTREESALLREELLSARKALEQSQHRLEETYDKISFDKKLSQERNHIEQLEKQNRQQLHTAQHRKMQRLLTELQQKDVRLRSLTSDVEKSTVVNSISRTRMHRNLQEIESKLVKERALKFDALERVDDLQSAIMYTEQVEQRFGTTGSADNEIRRPKSTAIKLSKTSTRIRPLTSQVSGYVRRSNYVPVPLPKKRPHTAGNILRDRIAASVLFPDTSPINPEYTAPN